MKHPFLGKRIGLVGLCLIAVLGCGSLARPMAAQHNDEPASTAEPPTALDDLSRSAKDFQRTKVFIQAVMDRDLADPARKGRWSKVLAGPWVDYSMAVEKASLALQLAKAPAGNDQARWIDEAKRALAEASANQAVVQQLALKEALQVTDAETIDLFNNSK